MLQPLLQISREVLSKYMWRQCSPHVFGEKSLEEQENRLTLWQAAGYIFRSQMDELPWQWH